MAPSVSIVGTTSSLIAAVPSPTRAMFGEREQRRREHQRDQRAETQKKLVSNRKSHEVRTAFHPWSKGVFPRDRRPPAIAQKFLPGWTTSGRIDPTARTPTKTACPSSRRPNRSPRTNWTYASRSRLRPRRRRPQAARRHPRAAAGARATRRSAAWWPRRLARWSDLGTESFGASAGCGRRSMTVWTGPRPIASPAAGQHR